MRRKLTLAVIIVLAAAIVGACGGGAKSEEAKMTTASAPAQNSAARPADAKAPAAPPASPAPGGAMSGAPAGEPTPMPLDRKIIKNASFDVKVKDGDASVNKITASVTASGGYVQDVKQSGTKLQGRTINITVRVPSGQYEALTTIKAPCKPFA